MRGIRVAPTAVDPSPCSTPVNVPGSRKVNLKASSVALRERRHPHAAPAREPPAMIFGVPFSIGRTRVTDRARPGHRRCRVHRVADRPGPARGAATRSVVLDALLPAAHGTRRPRRPLADGVQLVAGDVRDPATSTAALRGVDAVCHQAAMVGLGVDVADMPEYVGCNDLGTAVLLAAMARGGRRPAGAGRVDGGLRRGPLRVRRPRRASARRRAGRATSTAGRFEPRVPALRRGRWRPGSVTEDAPPDPRNMYAATKLAQEHLAAAWARATGGAVVALRYHNVYGPGMPRDTPYAGRGRDLPLGAGARASAPRVFEDGGQRRDFVHVRDVAAANVAGAGPATAPERGGAPRAYNMGSGTRTPSATWPRRWPRLRRPGARGHRRVPARRRAARDGGLRPDPRGAGLEAGGGLRGGHCRADRGISARSQRTSPRQKTSRRHCRPSCSRGARRPSRSAPRTRPGRRRRGWRSAAPPTRRGTRR